MFGIAPVSAHTIPSGGLKEIPSKDDKVQVGAPNVTTSSTATAQNLQTTDTESTNRATTSSSATAHFLLHKDQMPALYLEASLNL